jgi:MFS family permease
VPPEKLCPDFLQFWAAGQLLASGHSPYTAEDQARVQRQLGWDKEREGLRIYEFLPYYYPPWLAMACMVFLPLGYPTAKLTWLVVNVELLLLSGYHLGRLLEGVPRWIALAAVPCFSFSLLSMLFGQISPLMLFLIVASFRLLAAGGKKGTAPLSSRGQSPFSRDYLAGPVLALMLTKPQIGVVIVGAILLWAVRQHRWPVLIGFTACLVALCIVCFAVIPDWPWQVQEALERTPLVTKDSPWLSVTWWAVLESLGVPRLGLWPAYVAVAGPSLVLLLRIAWDCNATAGMVFAWAVLTTFMVVPYARLYDLTILIIPLLLLLPGQLKAPWTAALLLACLLLSLVQLYWVRPSDPYRCEVSFFWLPAVLALAWFVRLFVKGRVASPECQQKATVA